MRFQLILVGLLAASAASSQTKIPLSSQTKNMDFSNAPYTKPFRSGISLPSSCGQGETFYVTTATPGANLYACTATNQWTQLSGSSGPSPIGHAGEVLTSNGTLADWVAVGGDVSGALGAQTVQALRGVPIAATAPVNGQTLVFNGLENRWEPSGESGSPLAAWPVTRTSDTILTLGAGPGLRIGASYCHVPASTASVEVGGGTGTIFLFIRPTCELVAAHNLLVTTCTNCTSAEGANFETNSFPLAQWTVTEGVLAASGISAVTPYGIQPLLAGQNVQFTYSGGLTQVHTFTAGVNLSDRALTLEWDNSPTVATVRAHLASWAVENGNSVVHQAALLDSGHLAGIVVAGEGISGKARLAIHGVASCAFENAVTALDWVVPGTTNSGNCRSAGTTKPSSGAIVGRVLQSGAAGTYPVLVDIQQ